MLVRHRKSPEKFKVLGFKPTETRAILLLVRVCKQWKRRLQRPWMDVRISTTVGRYSRVRGLSTSSQGSLCSRQTIRITAVAVERYEYFRVKLRILICGLFIQLTPICYGYYSVHFNHYLSTEYLVGANFEKVGKGGARQVSGGTGIPKRLDIKSTMSLRSPRHNQHTMLCVWQRDAQCCMLPVH